MRIAPFFILNGSDKKATLPARFVFQAKSLLDRPRLSAGHCLFSYMVHKKKK